eukprot:gene2152-2449_t
MNGRQTAQANIALCILPRIFLCTKSRIFGDERPIAKHQRKLWVNFVPAKRPKWVPTKHSVICAKHFNDADFQYPIRSIESVPKKAKHMLKRYEIGVNAVPSINLPDQPTEEGINETREDREKRNTIFVSANNQLLEEHISRHNIGASLNREKLNDTGDIGYISEVDMSCDEGMDMGSEYEEMSDGNNNESEYEEIRSSRVTNLVCGKYAGGQDNMCRQKMQHLSMAHLLIQECTAGYIGSGFESLLIGIAEEKLELYKKKIEVMIPAPTHSVLQKEDKMTAIDNFIARQSLTTTEVPPTSQPGIDDIHHLLFSN